MLVGELIVVLLVLGILAAIAVPTYSTLKENSVKRSVNSTLQAIDRAGEAAYASNTNLADVADAAAEGVSDNGDFSVTVTPGTSGAVAWELLAALQDPDRRRRQRLVDELARLGRQLTDDSGQVAAETG